MAYINHDYTVKTFSVRQALRASIEAEGATVELQAGDVEAYCELARHLRDTQGGREVEEGSDENEVSYVTIAGTNIDGWPWSVRIVH